MAAKKAKRAKKAVAKKKGNPPIDPIPKGFYDRPYQKRQPRDKDDVIVTKNSRGKRTVYRGGAKFDKLPAKPRGAFWDQKA
jgi:hypothetical protein